MNQAVDLDPARVGERVWLWNGQWQRPFGTAELTRIRTGQAFNPCFAVVADHLVAGSDDKAVPPQPDPFIDLLPASGVKLTPRHYSYLKISEGCNHCCTFSIANWLRRRRCGRAAFRSLFPLASSASF